MRRGTIVGAALRGDYTSKPRPYVVVQASRLIGATESITLCPLTSSEYDGYRFRTQIDPDEENGLDHPSTVMVDKILTVPTHRIRSTMGQISIEAEAAISAALRRWLDL